MEWHWNKEWGKAKNKPLVISYNTLYIYIILGWLSGSINLQAAGKVFITSVQAKGRARHLHRINNQILLRVKAADGPSQ